MIICKSCDDTGWVCEDHPHIPWQGVNSCDCGGAGMPCRCSHMHPDSHEHVWLSTGQLVRCRQCGVDQSTRVESGPSEDSGGTTA